VGNLSASSNVTFNDSATIAGIGNMSAGSDITTSTEASGLMLMFGSGEANLYISAEGVLEAYGSMSAESFITVSTEAGIGGVGHLSADHGLTGIKFRITKAELGNYVLPEIISEMSRIMIEILLESNIEQSFEKYSALQLLAAYDSPVKILDSLESISTTNLVFNSDVAVQVSKASKIEGAVDEL